MQQNELRPKFASKCFRVGDSLHRAFGKINWDEDPAEAQRGFRFFAVSTFVALAVISRLSKVSAVMLRLCGHGWPSARLCLRKLVRFLSGAAEIEAQTEQFSPSE